ncbi:hypothetical protein GGX14DRAFT_448903, partial [Mycena pura]
MDNCGAGCGKHATLRCSGCKSILYCGVECQTQNWKIHKKDCKSLASGTNASAEPEQNDKPRVTHCTGCALRFGGENGEPDTICPDCGYVACESCVCHNRRGSCYCENSNFGHNYCERVPEWYHCSSRTGKVYRGDNHPDEYLAKLHDLPADLWEKGPRKCRNCGEAKLCLIPGYTCN